ncbi:ATP-binding protein [Pseudobutyrivibrio sp.]|jgi:predicted AAA+ superfamily ATPase|uniref:ATP-binding protein n=1 Tax=Pseudobutyrivibrio sp. TaxID=2014367 RepID=UPI0025ED96A6|nr:ATP-binding protein [Pseudobutyrivibrio sp.]
MEKFKRENYLRKIRGFYDDDDIIKVITGVRRCGKSSLMETIANEIRDKGVPETNIIYIDLDKRGNRNIKTADALEEIIDGYVTETGLKYLFIDEIQNIEGFEELINGYRTDGGWSIFITGSNSYLLSGELVTKLTGRYLEFEMFPLTFEEYEKMKQFYGKPVDPQLPVELVNYIQESGFPKTIFIDDLADKQKYVQGVINEIFEKDIRKRVKIRKKETFEIVRRYIINNFGATTSINNICESLNNSGLNIGKATISRYIKALVDAKILYECDRFDMKSKRSLSGEKKYYLSDLGFFFASNTDNRINYGPTLENMLYIYACAHDCSVSIGKIGKLECDFIIRNREMDYSYVQVAYTIALSKETEDREYRALEMIKDNYPKYVMTTDYLLQNRNGIKHVNILNFMQNGQEF